jgi:hypothetical protein
MIWPSLPVPVVSTSWINRGIFSKSIRLDPHDFDHLLGFAALLAMPTPGEGGGRTPTPKMHISLACLSLQEQKELDAATNRDFYMHCNGASLDLPGLGWDNPGKQ